MPLNFLVFALLIGFFIQWQDDSMQITYFILVFLITFWIHRQNQKRRKILDEKRKLERIARVKKENLETEIKHKELRTSIGTRRHKRTYRDIQKIFGEFILHEIKEHGCFVIPDVGQWKINNPKWPISFIPRKSLRKQIKNGELDERRHTKSDIEYARNYEIWFKLGRSQRTRNKLSMERRFYLRLFEFYCNTIFEKKNIRFHLINPNKYILEDVILFTNDLRNEIIQSLVSMKPVEIDILGSLSVKPRKVNVHGRESETKKIYFHPTRKFIAHCKNMISKKG